MSDPNAGKYRQLYADDFATAQKALREYGGELTWSTADYEAFAYKSETVRLVFYPHRTSARNHHIRVRDNGSQDTARVREILGALRLAAGHCCTFSTKHGFRAQNEAADQLLRKRATLEPKA